MSDIKELVAFEKRLIGLSRSTFNEDRNLVIEAEGNDLFVTSKKMGYKDYKQKPEEYTRVKVYSGKHASDIFAALTQTYQPDKYEELFGNIRREIEKARGKVKGQKSTSKLRKAKDWQSAFPHHKVVEALEKVYEALKSYDGDLKRDHDEKLSNHKKLVGDALSSLITTKAKVKRAEEALYYRK